MTALRFTEADAVKAYDDWGANCGPGALAAVMGLTLDEVRPHLIGFDSKRYTNPTMMLMSLKSLGAQFSYRVRAAGPLNWPQYGLCRVQWEGPWTKPGVPARVAYRYTHWVGAQTSKHNGVGIFDINAMNSGGWISLEDWSTLLVPWLLNQLYKKADGGWHLTHVVEIAPP